MAGFLKKRIKQCFCKHEEELISEKNGELITRCKKCGKIRVAKLKWLDTPWSCKF